MKIAVFYTNSHTAAWSLTLGLTDTLGRMGHEVLHGPIVPGSKTVSRASLPSLDELKSADAILVSGPEYLTPYLKALYPEWASIGVPKAAWYHESNHREDREFHFEKFMPFYDFNFFPAPQDAEELKGEFLPFGVDRAMFNLGPLPISWTAFERAVKGERDIDLGFVGLLYGKRIEFLRSSEGLARRLRVGNCFVSDMDGINIRKSATEYANNLRNIKIFLSLPSLSRLVVTKCYEAMACGALCVIPMRDTSPLDTVPAYDNADEALRIVDSFLANDEFYLQELNHQATLIKDHDLKSRLEVMLTNAR